MKKILLPLLLAGFVSLTASAQTRVGGHLAYGTEIEKFGLGGVGEFFIQDNMAISPSLTFFFPDDVGPGKVSWWELNANFNYYFIPDGGVNVYGLAGLNFGTWKYNPDGAGDSQSDTEIGLNLGFGLNFALQNSKALPFAEMKYAISDFDQVVFAFGVKVNVR